MLSEQIVLQTSDLPPQLVVIFPWDRQREQLVNDTFDVVLWELNDGIGTKWWGHTQFYFFLLSLFFVPPPIHFHAASVFSCVGIDARCCTLNALLSMMRILHIKEAVRLQPNPTNHQGSPHQGLRLPAESTQHTGDCVCKSTCARLCACINWQTNPFSFMGEIKDSTCEFSQESHFEDSATGAFMVYISETL